LAAFDLPPRRAPEDLWRGDSELLRLWASGAAPQCIIRLAVNAEPTILGVALTQLKAEMLSGTPSAHLEVLAVRADAEGRGIAKALVHDAEAAVRARGATTLSLNVFATNGRARGVYERLGFEEELIRYIKYLT
ncbi:MAG: N-acetyltransferase, partial [Gemmatimonadaceae bacterium]